MYSIGEKVTNGSRKVKNFYVVLLSALVFIFCFSSVYSLNSLEKLTQVVYSHPYRVATQVGELREISLIMEKKLRSIIKENDVSKTEEDKKELARLENYFDQLLACLKEEGSINNDVVEEVETHFNIIKEQQKNLIRKKESVGDGLQFQEGMKSVSLIYQELSSKLDELVKSSITEMRTYVEKARKTSIVTSVISILLAMTMIGITIYYEKVKQRNYKEIRYRDNLFGLLSNNLDDVFTIYNLKGKRNEYVAENTERILGVKNTELMKDHKLIFRYMHQNIEKEIIEHLENITIHSSYDKTTIYKNPVTKQECFLRIRVYPVVTDNEVEQIIITASDITDIRKSQQIVTDALANAQNANLSKRNFLSHISHDIRTPLNALIGLTTLAKIKGDASMNMDEYLDKIAGYSKHLLGLINDILDLSKMENGKYILRDEEFDLYEFIHEIQDLVAPQAENANLVFQTTLSNIHTQILVGDTLRLTQILMNLLSNAVKFTPAKKKICLEVIQMKTVGGNVPVIFKVSDEGIGMDEHTLERLYMPFEQGENQNSNTPIGSGLGMAITKNLVHIMGGNIEVDSAVDKGTEFTVYLNLQYKDNKKDIKIEKDPITINNIKQYDFSKKRVLIVEDNEINMEIINEVLKLTHANITCASSGFEAVELFGNSTLGYFDVILMDLQLPIIDGYEATKIIRRSRRSDALSVTILALSANVFHEDVTAAFAAGVNNFVEKPIDVVKLYEILAHYLEE